MDSYGTGFFTVATQRFETAFEIVTADFTRDGYEDLAITDRSEVKILRSNRNGTLTETVSMTVSGSTGLQGR